MKNKKRHIAELVAIIALLVIAVFFMDTQHACGVKLISGSRLMNITAGKEYVERPENVGTLIRVEGELVPYDEEANCFHIVQAPDKGFLQGKISCTDDNVKMYWLGDNDLFDRKETVVSGKVYKLVMVWSDYYSVCDVQFTGMPYVYIRTDDGETVPNNKNYGVAEYTKASVYAYDPEIDGYETVVIQDIDAEVRCSGTGEKYTIKTFNDGMRVDTAFFEQEAHDAWNISLVNPKDITGIRGILAYYIWNSVNDIPGADIHYELVELNVNGEYKGLGVLTPRIDDDYETYETVIDIDASRSAPKNSAAAVFDEVSSWPEDIDYVVNEYAPVNICNYLISIQLSGAYSNINNNFSIATSPECKGTFVVPGRMEYAMDIYPDRLEWLDYYDFSGNWKAYIPERICDKTYFEKIYNRARAEGLSEENIFGEIDRLSSMLTRSGYVARSGYDRVLDSGKTEYEGNIGVVKGYVSGLLKYYDEEYFAQTPCEGVNIEDGYIDVVVEFGAGAEDGTKLYIKDGRCYLFFPGYANDNDVRLTYDETKYSISLGDRAVDSYAGISISELLQVEKIIINDQEFSLSIEEISNLPNIYLSSIIGDRQWFDSDKTHKAPTRVECVSTDGEVSVPGSAICHARGKSSFRDAIDKTYKLKFDDKTSLIGMPEAKEIILQANALDRSQMRNELSYEMIRSLGMNYAFETAYCNLYIDGEYAGCYLAMPAISEIEQKIEAENGYFISYQDENIDCHTFNDIYDYDVQITIADHTEKGLNQAEERYLLVEKLIEEAVYDVGTYEKLKEYIDVESFICNFVTNVITNEVDLNYRSTYYYISGKDGKLYAGPMWDYDRAFGSVVGYDGLVELNYYREGLPEKLYRCEQFRNDVKTFMSLHTDLQEKMNLGIEKYTKLLKASADIEFIMYGYYINDYAIEFGNFDNDVKYLKQYANDRYELIADMIYNDSVHMVRIINPEWTRDAWIRDGESLSGGLIERVAAIDGHFDVGEDKLRQPVYDDWDIYVKGSSSDEGETMASVVMDEINGLGDENFVLSDNNDRTYIWEEIKMSVLGLIILLFPGMFVLLISNQLELDDVKKLPALIARYFCYDFAVVAFIYLVIFVLKGSITLNLASGAEGYDYTLYSVRVVIMIMALDFIGAIALGIVVRLLRKKRLLHTRRKEANE